MEYKLIPYQESEWLILSNEDIDDQESHYSSKYGGEIHSHKHRNNEETCSNIIACTKKIDKSIPLIRKEQLIFSDSVEKLALEAYPVQQEVITETQTIDVAKLFRNKWIEGYNKHAETHPFTLEDIRNAVQFGTSIKIEVLLLSDMTYPRTVEKYIQSLQQPKKEYIVEIEMIQRTILGEDPIFYTEIKIDKEGYINIVNIKAL